MTILTATLPVGLIWSYNKGLILTLQTDGRSSTRCHRRRVILDSRQLLTRQRRVSAHHGSAGGYIRSTVHVLRIGGHVHHWKYRLRNRSIRSRHARGSNNPGNRWRRYTEREFDHFVGPGATTAAVKVSGLHTAGVLFRHTCRTHHWRSLDQDTMAMVS